MQDCQTDARDDRGLIFGRFMVEDVLLAVVLLIVGFYGTRYCMRAFSPRLIVYLAFSIFFAVSIWALARFGKREGETFFAHKVYPVVFSIVAVLGLVFFPPVTVPDEPYHFLKSYATANILTPGMDTYDMRNEDVAMLRDGDLYNTQITKSFWEKSAQLPPTATHDGVARDFLTTIKDTTFDITIDLPQLKLPSALGIMLGRSLGLSGVLTYYLGRLFNALYAVALIVLAVRLAPVGKNAIMAVSMLPMTLHLIGSYSYDAAYIGLALLETGLLLRLLYNDEPISPQLMVGFLVTGALLTPGKLIYALLTICGVVVPASRFSSKRAAMIFKGCTVLVPVSMVAIVNSARVLAVIGVTPSNPAAATDGLDHRGAESGHFYTIGEIVSDPIGSAQFLWGTLQHYHQFYFTGMLGGSLGWFQANLIAPLWEDVCMLVPLLMGLFRSNDDERALDRAPRIGFCLAAFLGASAIVMTMWVSWTFHTDLVINGVQGRYMLPFLPALLLGIRPRRIKIPSRMAPSILLGLSSFACFYWAQICYLVTV